MNASSGINSANWTDDLHWSFGHMDALFPNEPIPAGGEVSGLRQEPREFLDLAVSDARGRTVGEILATTDTDGWLVLHGDRILSEGYFGDAQPTDRHLLMSVSKSIVATLTGMLIDDGILALEDTVGKIIPELANAGYGGATVRDLLDMRSGVRFSEEYLEYDSEVRMLDEVAGWAPLREGGPATLKELLAGLVTQREHGAAFEYRSSETDMLGWLLEEVSGRSFAELASERLWSRIGAEREALLLLDRAGTGLFDGGICATVRDLARFGALIRDGGITLGGERLLSAAWIDDLFAGAPDSASRYAESASGHPNSGGMYHNMFWFLDERRDVACGLGIHGQMLYINRSNQVVGVKTSSWPLPVDETKGAATLAMFDAVTAEIAG